MALPEGITTAVVTAGVPVTHTGGPVKAFLSIEPSVFLVHTATGTPLVDFLEELSINEGVAGQFTLPHTDQAGFQDENGNAYTNWYYTARISYSTPSKAKTKAPKIKVFQLATGQTVVDLDSLPGGAPALPYVAPIATVTSVNGRTGPVTIEDGDLPERLSDASLTATYGPDAAPMQAAFASPRFARPKPTRNQPQVTVMTTFQAGHGWVANSGTWTADTADYALGSQSIRTTATTTSSSFRRLGQPAMDMTDRDFAALIKVDVPTELSALHLYIGRSNLASYEPVLAAIGGISANSTILPNTWTWVYFSWADAGNPVGTPDRTAITDWQVRVLGKTATPVTVWLNAIGHYERRQVFPKGCISFACDDGRLSQVTRMAPALDKYGYGATAYLIVGALGTVDKGTYQQFKDLENYHRWEIAGHAYSTNAHNNGMTSLSLPDLDVELRALRNWLQQGNHKGADLFAYPLGFDNKDVIEVVSRYFVNARQITRVPYQNADLDQPYRMRSNSISSSDPLAVAKQWVDKAAANGTWLTITMHDIVDGTPASGTEWNTADFQALVDYVAASGAEVMPVGAALDRVNANQPTLIAGPEGPAGPAGAVPIVSARKTADTIVNNSVTLTADPELSVPVVAGGIYQVEAFLIYSASTVADLSLGWSYPAASTMDWSSNALISSITGNTGSLYRGRLAINGVGWAGGAGATAGSKLVALPSGIFTAAASGNLTLTWAQIALDPTDATVYANSMLKLTKLN